MPPTVESSPMEMAVLEHEDVSLTCIISGSSAPLVSWEREGASLPVMSRTRIKSSESRNANTGISVVRTVMLNTLADLAKKHFKKSSALQALYRNIYTSFPSIQTMIASSTFAYRELILV